MLSVHKLEKRLGLLLSVYEENKTERFWGKKKKKRDIIQRDSGKKGVRVRTDKMKKHL